MRMRPSITVDTNADGETESANEIFADELKSTTLIRASRRTAKPMLRNDAVAVTAARYLRRETEIASQSGPVRVYRQAGKPVYKGTTGK